MKRITAYIERVLTDGDALNELAGGFGLLNKDRRWEISRTSLALSYGSPESPGAAPGVKCPLLHGVLHAHTPHKKHLDEMTQLLFRERRRLAEGTWSTPCNNGNSGCAGVKRPGAWVLAAAMAKADCFSVTYCRYCPSSCPVSQAHGGETKSHNLSSDPCDWIQ